MRERIVVRRRSDEQRVVVKTEQAPPVEIATDDLEGPELLEQQDAARVVVGTRGGYEVRGRQPVNIRERRDGALDRWGPTGVRTRQSMAVGTPLLTTQKAPQTDPASCRNS